MKTTLYVITNISMPNLCKVGITDNIQRRLKDLNSTNVPTRFQVYEIFETNNVELLEQEVLTHFTEKRLNKKKEFIEEHPERVCEFIRENKDKIKLEKETKSKFDKAGIPAGSELYFIYGDIFKDIKAVVLKNGKILFDGKETSLSASAQKILAKRFDRKWRAVQGTVFWTFNGKIIKEYFE